MIFPLVYGWHSNWFSRVYFHNTVSHRQTHLTQTNQSSQRERLVHVIHLLMEERRIGKPVDAFQMQALKLV